MHQKRHGAKLAKALLGAGWFTDWPGTPANLAGFVHFHHVLIPVFGATNLIRFSHILSLAETERSRDDLDHTNGFVDMAT
jgi:hypothetical protein